MIPFADPRAQPLDANGKVLPGAQLSFFDAGTTNPRTVYADYLRTTPLTQPVLADASGRFPVIYEPTGQYKMLLADVNSVTIYTADFLDGPFDPSTLTAAFAQPVIPAIVRTTSGSIATTDLSKLIVCDTSGGSFSQTMPLVSASGNKVIVIRKQSATGALTLTAGGTDVIYSAAGTVTSYQMSTNGSTVMLVPSGGGWYVWEQLAIAANDGTAANPAFAFASQAGVGIFKSASNTLAFATAGILQGSVDGSGNLAVVGSVSAGGNASIGPDGTARSVSISGNQASLATGRPSTDNAELKLGSFNTSQGGGIEFEVSGATNGSGWKIAAPNFASGSDSGSLLFLGRNNAGAWTEFARLSQAGMLGVGSSSPAYFVDAPGIRSSSSGYTFPDASVQTSAAKPNYAPDVIIEHQLASGTGAGTSTSGSFETRPLNTLVRNIGAIASLASNQVTLPIGTYYIRITSPALNGDKHKVKLRNVTDASDALVGTNEDSNSTNSNRSEASGVVVLAASKSFSVQHWVTNGAANGWGIATSSGLAEVYARFEAWKIA